MGYGRWLTLVLLLALPIGTAQAESCVGVRVEIITAVDAQKHKLLCDSATAALSFLARFKLDAAQTIRIAVVEQPLLDQQHPLYGSYDASEDLVRVMSQQAIMAQSESPLIYGQPFGRDHYRGIVAHEIAHAVVQQHAPDLNRTAQEYLAHVTQLALQPEQSRLRIIKEANVDAWQRGDVISDIYMAMAPTQFAVKCYLHLTRHPQPVELVQMLLASKWRYVVVVI